jgi:predicted DNA-binding transcriptional regulator AlpA
VTKVLKTSKSTDRHVKTIKSHQAPWTTESVEREEFRAADPIPVRLLDEREAAARLGLSARTLQKWRLLGCGPRFFKLGHAVRYAETEVHGFIQKRLRTSTSDVGTAAPDHGAS